MSQINESEIEDIMIEIQRMNLSETKDVNSIGHVKPREKSNFLKKGKMVISIKI